MCAAQCPCYSVHCREACETSYNTEINILNTIESYCNIATENAYNNCSNLARAAYDECVYEYGTFGANCGGLYDEDMTACAENLRAGKAACARDVEGARADAATSRFDCISGCGSCCGGSGPAVRGLVFGLLGNWLRTPASCVPFGLGVLYVK